MILLLLGVADSGKIVGEKLTNKMKAEINALARNCDPQINIKSIQQIGEVVVLEIAEGEEKPYSSSSGYYCRLDAVTQKMTQKEVNMRFRENNNFYFESSPCNNMTIQNISLAKVKTFLQETGTSYKVNRTNLPLVLSSLRVIDYGTMRIQVNKFSMLKVFWQHLKEQIESIFLTAKMCVMIYSANLMKLLLF
jgi:ATP-dependent DNA helicase RecG